MGSLNEPAGDDEPHDFVGSFQNAVNAQVAHDFLDPILGEACGRMRTSVFITILAPRSDFHDPRLGGFLARQFSDDITAMKDKHAIADPAVFLHLR